MPFVNPAGTKALGAYRGNHFFAASVWHRNDIPNSVFLGMSWAPVLIFFISFFGSLSSTLHVMGPSWNLAVWRTSGNILKLFFFFYCCLVDHFIVLGHSVSQCTRHEWALTIWQGPLLATVHYIFANLPTISLPFRVFWNCCIAIISRLIFINCKVAVQGMSHVHAMEMHTLIFWLP